MIDGRPFPQTGKLHIHIYETNKMRGYRDTYTEKALECHMTHHDAAACGLVYNILHK